MAVTVLWTCLEKRQDAQQDAEELDQKASLVHVYTAEMDVKGGGAAREGEDGVCV